MNDTTFDFTEGEIKTGIITFLTGCLLWIKCRFIELVKKRNNEIEERLRSLEKGQTTLIVKVELILKELQFLNEKIKKEND